jgi:hypothetical protein
MWQRFFKALRVKRQKASASNCGGGGTRDGLSGRPGTLLQISYFTDESAVHNILQYYFGTGEDNE